MKNVVLIILIGFFILSCERKSGRSTMVNNPIAQKTFDYYINVIRITDGDTFTGLTRDNIEIRFRIHGIDAPERKQAFSSKSQQKLSELIYGKHVGIKVHTKQDRYGRPVVYVYTKEGLDVGAEMIKSGMAWHFKKYDNSKYYSQLEDKARSNKIGLWFDDSPIPPWSFRGNKN